MSTTTSAQASISARVRRSVVILFPIAAIDVITTSAATVRSFGGASGKTSSMNASIQRVTEAM